ncbi:MAG: CotH kinase family protein [Tenericutes bacterium]|nr:CotH kinase family protein [Mycoplasmatota bacterium]
MKKTLTILSFFILVFIVASCDSTSSVENTTLNTTIETSEDVLNTDTTATTENSAVTTELSGSVYQEDEMVDEVVYPHNEVIEVNIDITSENYNDIINNAMDEEYHTCDITYNGYSLTNVAIRTKGNSSLRDVFNANGDRFSYNIDLNYYEKQDLFGIDKLILNNLYMDPSMIAEYITYEALDYLGAVSSRTTFVALSFNGEYYGLYLSVEHVGNEFLDTNFNNSDGEQYKPDSGVGANLNYISDSTNYSALVDENSDDLSNKAIIELMKRIDSGDDLVEIFNVESYLKYLAVSTYTVNLDSYQGGMYHNYYLYNNDGVFEWIAWDLNMAFNGFPGVRITDLQATEYLIDEPVINSLSSYPLIESILSNETYLEMYHSYLQELIDGYFNIETFEQRVNEIAEMIDDYVETDPSSFYTYTAYQNALFTDSTLSYSILQFVETRSENIDKQLSGLIPSTNGGKGNVVSSTRPPR